MPPLPAILAPLNFAKVLLILQPFVPKIRDSFSAFAPRHRDDFLSRQRNVRTQIQNFSSCTVWYLCLPSQLHFAFRHDYFVTELCHAGDCLLALGLVIFAVSLATSSLPPISSPSLHLHTHSPFRSLDLSSPLQHQRSLHGPLPCSFTSLAAEYLPSLILTTG